MQLDQLHYAILNELQRNSRLSNVEIGRKIGLTSPAVAERIRKLEEAKIIKSFTVNLDYEKLGFNENVIIGIDIPYCDIPPFLKEIENINGILKVMKSTGEFCLIIHLVTRRIFQLEEIITRFSKHGRTSTFRILAFPLERDFVQIEGS
ncbi:Lrp/AsnC family transcriptional regulator [Chryseobacterium paridis]|uniref:Lrp/AsnC family transcriptional regulator n=1 Tax=Chryseobacterium paridis TaxID=2800328 RepID=A0ABS1FZQ2_9FLAO|nr:Lrp/AsnC family transcriptional regulator [Chryseobacterium paridis]MBK1897923.1 Lrp/AsnC family transcriptional regulator [Chryseobacterium paridis]